jgi:hypothetical protein
MGTLGLYRSKELVFLEPARVGPIPVRYHGHPQIQLVSINTCTVNASTLIFRFIILYTIRAVESKNRNNRSSHIVINLRITVCSWYVAGKISKDYNNVVFYVPRRTASGMVSSV